MTYGISQSLFCALIYALSLNPKLEYDTASLNINEIKRRKLVDRYIKRKLA